MESFFGVFVAGAFGALFVATGQAGLIGRGTFPLPPEDRRIGCVDGLRGYLALSVMVHHFFIWVRLTRLGAPWEAPPINFINQLGEGGVALFFMTTGLVFYPRILAGFRATDWTSVFVGRIFRIIPLVALSLVLILLVIALRTGHAPGSRDLLPIVKWISGTSEPPLAGYASSDLMNARVLWSLRYEWLFYCCVLPIAAAFMGIIVPRGIPSWTVPAGIVGASILAQGVFFRFGAQPSILKYLPLFALGMLAFEVQRRPKIRAVLARTRMAIPALAALSVGMMFTRFPYGVSLPLFGFFFACVACGNSIGGVLRTRGALVLGECSFGIYLLHGLALNILFIDVGAARAGIATDALPLLMPVIASLVMLATPLTYLCVERPAIRIGKDVARWLVRPPMPSPTCDITVAP